MDKFRKSFRSSFRKKKDDIPLTVTKQWPQDRDAVRANTCSLQVKYLGCVEVFEGRGLHICEEAIKLMKNSKRRPIKGSLHVSCDGLKLVDASTQGLVVDQTIEKVSFCSPDRNFLQGFSYICRDGATKRWMCHGFMAVKDTGERLSHAVGCAFAICLENKQKRDRQCSVSINFDSDQSTFTRFGSFRQGSFTERLQDPQMFKPAEPIAINNDPVSNPHAVSRPRVSSLMYERATSMRGMGRFQLSGSSPFKRQASLRISELPSMLERQDNLIEIENHKTNDDIRRAKISPLPPGFMISPRSDFSLVQGKEAMTDRLSSIAYSQTFSPSSVDSNMFHLSVSQPTSTGQVTNAIKTNSSLDGQLLCHTQNTVNPPQPQPASSPTFVSPPINTETCLLHLPPGNNPWDNVPDQFHIRRCDSTKVSRTEKNGFSDVNNSPAIDPLEVRRNEKNDFSTNVNNSPAIDPLEVRRNEKNGFSTNVNNSPVIDPLEVRCNEKNGFSDVNNSSAIDPLEVRRNEKNDFSTNVNNTSVIDPFNTEWAKATMSNNSETETSSNLFSRLQAVETFKIQM